MQSLAADPRMTAAWCDIAELTAISHGTLLD